MGRRLQLLAILALFQLVFYCSGENKRRVHSGREYRCPAEFVRLGAGCYWFSSHVTPWQEAHFQCRDRNAQLIALETEWEDKIMRAYLRRHEFAPLSRWTGGFYNWSSRRWIWVAQGEQMRFKNFNEQPLIRQDGNGQSLWHCVLLNSQHNFQWSQQECTHNLHFICEAPLQRIVTTSTPEP